MQAARKLKVSNKPASLSGRTFPGLLGIAALAAFGLVDAPVHAQTLSFEGLSNNESVGNFYNGGTGGSGSTGGTNYGISFPSNALAIISDQAGGNGNFNVTPLTGKTILYFLSGSGDTLNDAGGFSTGFSFDYSAINAPGIVTVYSGLDNTGTQLASLSLPTTPAVPPGRYDPFLPAGVTFNGVAHSVDFSGTANHIGFDNITVNSATPGTPGSPSTPSASVAPEPSSTADCGVVALIAAGLVLKARKRKSAPYL